MKNPWETISLYDYENHMSLDSVKQLQTLNEIMRDQFNRYNVTTAMILGVAGGNGLNNINPKHFNKVYGIDINPDYLEECVRLGTPQTPAKAAKSPQAEICTLRTCLRHGLFQTQPG